MKPPDDTGCTILHVDMDSFFASIEIRDDPALAGRPVVVGGDGTHGVVAAASYAARAYGIHSAMPMAGARRRCPELVVVPPRGNHYRAVSAQVMEILHGFSAEVQQISVDEAFLDVSGARRQFGAPAAIAAAIRAAVRERTALACTIGVARSPSIAKIASSRGKPDGLLVVPAAETRAFLAPLPVTVVWGIGAVAARKLHDYGIVTVRDLTEAPDAALRAVFGPAAPRVRAIARGEESPHLVRGARDRSIGTERTYDDHLVDPAAVHAELVDLCDRVARSLRRHGHAARTMTLKVRDETGETRTRSHTFPHPVKSAEPLREHVDALFQRAGGLRRPVRLLGLRAEALVSGDAPLQTELADRAGWTEIERVMDAARNRFGSAGVTRASTVRPRPPSVPNGPGTP